MRLLLLDADPDWNPAVARDALDFEAALTRIAELFDAADKSCGGGGAPAGGSSGGGGGGGGRRARYVENGRTVLSVHRDKVRWIRDWYLARSRPGGGAASSRYGGQQAQQQQQAYYRGGGEADALPGGVGAKEQIVGAGVGGAMEVDYSGAMQQAQAQAQDAGAVLPGEMMMDEGFWQAMFDWSWNAPSMDFPMEVQA